MFCFQNVDLQKGSHACLETNIGKTLTSKQVISINAYPTLPSPNKIMLTCAARLLDNITEFI